MFAGAGVGLGNAFSLAACLLLPAIGYAERIPREEALLAARAWRTVRRLRETQTPPRAGRLVTAAAVT